MVVPCQQSILLKLSVLNVNEVLKLTKAQRLKAQRVLLETLIKTNPEVERFLDSLLKKETVEQADIIEPIIKEQLKQARAIGASIGWQAAFLRCEEAVNSMESVEEIKVYVSGEAKKVRKELNMKEKE